MAHFHVGEFNFSSFVSRKWSLKEFHSVTLSSRSCSFECICWHPSLHFEQRLGSSALSLMWLSACWVHRVRGLIRLVRKGMESHPSCQIQLCAPLASKREEIFHFPHFSVGFYVCVCSSPLLLLPLPLCHPRSHVYPILSSILQLTPPPPSFFLFFSFPCGCGWRSPCTLAHFHRGKRESEAGKRTRGTVRIAEEREEREGCPQYCALITFLL